MPLSERQIRRNALAHATVRKDTTPEQIAEKRAALAAANLAEDIARRLVNATLNDEQIARLTALMRGVAR